MGSRSFKISNSSKKMSYYQLKTPDIQCPGCPKKFKYLWELKRHVPVHVLPDQKEKYPCSLCHKTFAAERYVKNHIRGVHKKIKIYKCKKCPKPLPRFTSIEQFEIHTRKLHLTCKICGQVFNTRGKANIHSKIHSQGLQPFECKICFARFRNKSNLTDHSRIHTGERPFPCDKCNKTFSRKSVLISHKQTHLAKSKEFACSVCNKFFKSLRFKKKHERNYHELAFKVHDCTLCEKSFKTVGGLQRHLLIHGNQWPVKCPMCPRTFRMRHDMDDHIRSHTKERPFSCYFCNKTFATHNTVRQHLHLHTTERPYKCNLLGCKKSYKTIGGLQRHLMVHGGERPINCPLCPSTFRMRQEMYIHMRCHTKERPFSCYFCNKMFPTYAGVLGHLHLHTKERFYKCSVLGCNQTSTSRGNRDAHKLVHKRLNKLH